MTYNSYEKEVRRIYTIDYYAYGSGMKGWNSQYKAIVAMGALLFCIGADDWKVSVFVFLSMGAVTIFAGKFPWRNYLVLLRLPLAFLIMGTAAIVIGFSSVARGTVLVSVWGHFLYLQEGGIELACGLVLKAMAALSAMYMLVLSTPAGEIISILRRLRVPKIIVELMNMIYRFIFVLMDTQYKMKLAAESRLGFSNFKTSCRTFGSGAGNLFVISLKKAGVYYDAMAARCYDGDLLFLEEEKKWRGWQVCAGAGYFLILILISAVPF